MFFQLPDASNLNGSITVNEKNGLQTTKNDGEINATDEKNRSTNFSENIVNSVSIFYVYIFAFRVRKLLF